MTRPDLKPLEALVPRFGRSLARGETAPADERLIVLLSGRAMAIAGSEDAGERVVRRLNVGDFIGEECLAGESSTLLVRALDAVEALIIPAPDMAELFRAAPDYALHLTKTLYRRTPRATAAAKPAVAEAKPAAEQPEPKPTPLVRRSAPAASKPQPTPPKTTAGQPLSFNEDRFYADTGTCPACATAFDYVRVRTRAVHSIRRESDFYYHYRAVNPLHYAIVVCPHCLYAAYGDDFEKLTAEEAQAINEAAAERTARAEDDFRGERDLAIVAASFRLALACYRARGSGAARNAGLLHRLGWVAREAGDAATEQRYLDEALQEYRRAYETDRDVSDAKGVNLAYFIGELSLRLDRLEEAVQWFTLITRLEESRRHPEILRLTRERWGDAREAMKARKGRSA